MKDLKLDRKTAVKNTLLILVGSLVYSIGFIYILLPNSVPTGGIGGIAMIINRFTNLPVGTMIIVLNIPLFIIAWRKLGLRFMLASVIGTLVSSVIIDIISLFPHTITQDPFLTCIFGGIIYQGVSEGKMQSHKPKRFDIHVQKYEEGIHQRICDEVNRKMPKIYKWWSKMAK